MKAPRTAAAAIIAAGALLATGSLALAAGPRAHATATPQGGTIQVFISNLGPTKSKVTITGAIGDYGTGISETKQGKVNPNGAYEELKLKHGTMLVDAAPFDKAIDHAHPQINTSNCSFFLTASGPSTIMSGTGAYAGAHGKITLTAQFGGIGPKKANGHCNMSNNAPTFGGFFAITGKGTVSF
jgi:hypothetical protein